MRRYKPLANMENPNSSHGCRDDHRSHQKSSHDIHSDCEQNVNWRSKVFVITKACNISTASFQNGQDLRLDSGRFSSSRDRFLKSGKITSWHISLWYYRRGRPSLRRNILFCSNIHSINYSYRNIWNALLLNPGYRNRGALLLFLQYFKIRRKQDEDAIVENRIE